MKSKTAGFTLIELLVVMTIIAILATLAAPTYNIVQRRAQDSRARNDAAQIKNALNSYLSEYRVLPADWGTGGADSQLTPAETTLFFQDLRNTPDDPSLDNARGITFLEVNAVEDPMNPINGIGDDGVYYDPWGSPYQIAIDGNYDGVIDTMSPLPAYVPNNLPGKVAVWSFGRDGAEDDGVDGDDIGTWQ